MGEEITHRDRQRPAECLHLVATGLIMEECEDNSVMSESDNGDYGSFRVRQRDALYHTVIWSWVSSLSNPV